MTPYGNPEKIKKICEWTGKEFEVDWKHRKQRFIDKLAMYEWRKSQNHEIVSCLNCGKPFERYKNILHPRTGKPTQYCSNKCNITSNEKKQKLIIWGLSDKNHRRYSKCKQKIKEIKFKKYGDENYNNVEKNKQTMMNRYGVPYSFYLPQCMSNGKRISNFQRRVYVDVLKTYSDAILEKYLKDVQKSVDIFIPSINKVIECHGDYWHCNPSKCRPDYYNKLVHLTAQEIWDRDKQKFDLLTKNGYIVEVIWENVNKHFKHSIK